MPSLAGFVTARQPVIIYDGPSTDSNPRYLLGKDYPVTIISETSQWLKVCLHDQTTGYLERRDVVPGNNVIVIRPTVLRSDPSDSGGRMFKAAPQLLLTSTGEPIGGWLPIRHSSGSTGFVQLQDIWGNSGC